ncbi:guanine nucleotide-binding protein subunit gamma 3-like [Durio zibethinus]|uniref:Guanine nucleotide-binding protein subunit gamma 3-like n=1 Tax=Durio zibethinus TaxID=66656 RepID=A0A6P5ZVA1_DURZI|nr:guanine nucleotide-binding protein subunit gamma 3-like [Durio zibethinus]
MAARSGGSSFVPSLPPPCPKFPPEYPDLYGKRRETAKIQMLQREISFLEEELKSVESIQHASRCCKEVTDFVMANSDPLIPTSQKNQKTRRFWKWLCGMPCLNLSWICCYSGCSCNLKCPWCCDYNLCGRNLCNCSSCICSLCNCRSCNCSFSDCNLCNCNCSSCICSLCNCRSCNCSSSDCNLCNCSSCICSLCNCRSYNCSLSDCSSCKCSSSDCSSCKCSSCDCSSCKCYSCNCNSCLSFCTIPKWQCCSFPKSHCCRKISCSRNRCIFPFASCTDCCCCTWKCPCRQCPEVCLCCSCRKTCCNPCCLLF